MDGPHKHIAYLSIDVGWEKTSCDEESFKSPIFFTHGAGPTRLTQWGGMLYPNFVKIDPWRSWVLAWVWNKNTPPETLTWNPNVKVLEDDLTFHFGGWWLQVSGPAVSFVCGSFWASRKAILQYRGTPKWMVEIMVPNPMNKWMIWGYHDFWKHPYGFDMDPIYWQYMWNTLIHLDMLMNQFKIFPHLGNTPNQVFKKRYTKPLTISGQITIIPKPELRAFWGDSLTKPPFGVTSAEVAIISPDNIHTSLLWCKILRKKNPNGSNHSTISQLTGPASLQHWLLPYPRSASCHPRKMGNFPRKPCEPRKKKLLLSIILVS